MDALDDILKRLDVYFSQHESAKEIDLIRTLQNDNITPFSEFRLSNSKDLFRAHFLLKHLLYKLQDLYFARQSFVLEISLVSITRRIYDAGSTALSSHDAVKAYYQNIRHYFETEEDEVNELLNGFWQRYLAGEDKSAALEVLDLPMDASHKQVKRRYRELAQQHHPDKGGCEEKFKAITGAKRLLDQVFVMSS